MIKGPCQTTCGSGNIRLHEARHTMLDDGPFAGIVQHDRNDAERHGFHSAFSAVP